MNKKLIAVGILFLGFSGTVASAESNSGTAAYVALGRVAPALREGNVRTACQKFGEYSVHAGYVTERNTDVWTRRNLRFAAEQVDSILSNFCSGPNSLTPREDAIRAAESAFATIGLESMPR